MMSRLLCPHGAFADSARGTARPVRTTEGSPLSLLWLRAEDRALFMAEHGGDYAKPYESSEYPVITSWFRNHFVSIVAQVEVQLP